MQIPLQHLTQLNPATIWSLEVQIRRKISFPDCLIRFARQMELDVNWHCVSSVQISMDMIRFSAVVHYSETGSPKSQSLGYSQSANCPQAGW